MEDSLQQHQSRKKNFFKNPFVILFGAFGLFVLSQIVGAFILVPLRQFASNENQQMFFYAAGILAALVCLLLIAARIIGFSRHTIGLIRPALIRILEVLPIFLLYMVASIALTLLVTQLMPSFDADQVQDVGFKDIQGMWPLVMAGISLVVLTPIYEEILFRGILFKGLRIRLPFLVSAGVSSLVFALAHGQWNVAVDTFALGVALSFLVERSGSILPAIALHMLKNGIAFTLLFLVKA